MKRNSKLNCNFTKNEETKKYCSNWGWGTLGYKSDSDGGNNLYSSNL